MSPPRMLRTRAIVVSESALIPDENRIAPPPNRFTHEVRDRQPYYYAATKSKQCDGEFAAGTKVVLMVQTAGRKMCRVVDGRGLYVLTSLDGLKQLR